MPTTITTLPPLDRFADRHIGPNADDVATMLETLGFDSMEALIDTVVPADIRMSAPLDIPVGLSEEEALTRLRELAAQNTVATSYLGTGYYGTITPPVILRNILENPGWYTAYTPYQPEIAQGRLEALLNFQTAVADLTGLEIANASLLDEATAVAEAVTMTNGVTRKKGAPRFLIDQNCHPQTLAVVQTRARVQGIEIDVTDVLSASIDESVTGVVVQYPDTEGAVRDYRGLCDTAHAVGALVTVATDLLSLTLLTPPGEWGADIAVGSAQRFGVPMGFGGPHAAFFATREAYKRHVPGRIIGVSRDTEGQTALRMALQTREQHIRREKATSNICTAQVLLAVIAAMYAVYHGPEGLRRIATRVHELAMLLARGLTDLGYSIAHEAFFDTLCVEGKPAILQQATAASAAANINLRELASGRIGIALDETTGPDDVQTLLDLFATPTDRTVALDAVSVDDSAIPEDLTRSSSFMDHPVFHRYRSETEMLRYLKRLEDRDLSLTSAMIPLGSCTMKLNATTEMIPVTWPEFGNIHPFAPSSQTRGYTALFEDLERQLAEITGFAAISLQPNAGSQGEFAGLLVIRAYHEQRGEAHRATCLIPQSAHGTNPASAVMAGMNVVVVKTDSQGNIDLEDLRAKTEQHRERLGALMVTYPSTHGVFEASIREVCDIVHAAGGQVYMDGANMNAQVGLCRPGDFGADVCHLNLHKTFCIPHGGGGPGMGPIGVAAHLAPFLPDHPLIDLGHTHPCGTISAAPWGSPSILTISWAYLLMMGGEGLTDATKVSILAANYIARRLDGHYDLLYAGAKGLIAHECIVETRPFKSSAGVSVEDIAKRLIDYGFHPPTISFPVAGTMMVEPTESESKEELDRFCDALIAIRDEIRAIETGAAEEGNNVLTNAPHPLSRLMADEWSAPYPRERAAFPTAETREHKIWPFVGRIDAAWGDRNLVCSCPPIEAYDTAGAA